MEEVEKKKEKRMVKKTSERRNGREGQAVKEGFDPQWSNADHVVVVQGPAGALAVEAIGEVLLVRE